MYKGKRNSVAMATYNGAKFIREQLLSICGQTVRPDEIVISDDGSKDDTLAIIQEIANSEQAKGITFLIFQDNPRKGYCGNFEWAVTHASGDYTFLCDQDDVWYPQKVETVMKIFDSQPNASLVIHNATLIDAYGSPLDGVFDDKLPVEILDGSVFHISRELYLDKAVSGAGIRGMCMCFTSGLKDELIPFPRTVDNHDKWVYFCAIACDSCYYVNSSLVHYRLHGNNTVGSQIDRGNMFQKLRRVYKNAVLHRYEYASYYTLGSSLEKKLCKLALTSHPAYSSALYMREIGKRFREIESYGRLHGVIALVKLYFSNKRIRRTGPTAILEAIIYTGYHGKKYRIRQFESS